MAENCPKLKLKRKKSFAEPELSSTSQQQSFRAASVSGLPDTDTGSVPPAAAWWTRDLPEPDRLWALIMRDPHQALPLKNMGWTLKKCPLFLNLPYLFRTIQIHSRTPLCMPSVHLTPRTHLCPPTAVDHSPPTPLGHGSGGQRPEQMTTVVRRTQRNGRQGVCCRAVPCVCWHFLWGSHRWSGTATWPSVCPT